MESQQAQLEQNERKAAKKFTYASGARPLDGYTIKRGVGQGGFGEVYYAVSDAGKEVALKLIRRNLDVELRGVRQCLNLKHPNLLAVHDIRNDDRDDHWIVMEYVSGESLEQVIDRNPNGMPAEEVIFWMRGIAAGVAHLHDRGIVHRDLKPGNIFFDEGIVKIGDYGLSKFITCSRRSGQTESVGTVHYMAPEIANGRYGKEIDTYALGVILYEMLTGRVPFEGESVGEVLMKHLTAEPEVETLSEPYRGIVERMLSKDPERRVSSAKDLLALLPAASPESFQAYEAVYPTATVVDASPSSAETVTDVEVVDDTDEEPIFRTLKAGYHDLQQQWASWNLPPLVSALVLIAIGVTLLTTAGVWLPILFGLSICYGIYYLIWTLIVPPRKQTPTKGQGGPHPRHAAGQQAGNRQQFTPVRSKQPTKQWHPNRRNIKHRRRDERWRQAQSPLLRARSGREKLTDLLGSLLMAPIVAAVMTVVMMLLHSPMSIEQFTWLAIVGTLGSWAVLIPAKLWEGRQGEQMPRRFVLLIVGLVWGSAAWGLAEFISPRLPYDILGEHVWQVGAQATAGAYDAAGNPMWLAYAAYFGFLMFIARWWRLADPLRSTRLSIWSTALGVFWATLLSLCCPFPQPWGLMIAATMAVTVQLSSPWKTLDEDRVA